MLVDDKAVVQHHDDELGLDGKAQHIDSADAEYVEGTPEEKKLVKKIDYHLIPILWAMYVFNYLDRTNIGVSYSLCCAVSTVTDRRRTPRSGAWKRISI